MTLPADIARTIAKYFRDEIYSVDITDLSPCDPCISKPHPYPYIYYLNNLLNSIPDTTTTRLGSISRLRSVCKLTYSAFVFHEYDVRVPTNEPRTNGSEYVSETRTLFDMKTMLEDALRNYYQLKNDRRQRLGSYRSINHYTDWLSRVSMEQPVGIIRRTEKYSRTDIVFGIRYSLGLSGQNEEESTVCSNLASLTLRKGSSFIIPNDLVEKIRRIGTKIRETPIEKLREMIRSTVAVDHVREPIVPKKQLTSELSKLIKQEKANRRNHAKPSNARKCKRGRGNRDSFR